MMKIFRGTLVHSTEKTPLEILEDQLLGVQDEKVIFVESGSNLSQVQEKYGFDLDCISMLSPDEFLMPGMVDTHIHASQYPQTGTNLDLPLLDWLQRYTFPLEARYSDSSFANIAYRKAVNRVLRNGTTTACYFATIHLEGTLELCAAAEDFGQRAFVGKVNMDRNSTNFYTEETNRSLEDSKVFIEAVLNKKNALLTPVVTPRFAGSCTPELLQGLGNLAMEYNIPIQSHISENKAECEWTAQLFPQHPTYTSVYDSYGLLNNQTVMAHGVYLSDEELKIFHNRGAGISHCPNSNISIRSGMFDVRNALNHGVKVGLGTDVSGGYVPSMLDAMRMAITTSNVLSLRLGADYRLIDFREAFRLATLGGASVLGLDEQIGNFLPGKDFDALLINVSSSGSPVDIFDLDTIEDKVQKFLLLGSCCICYLLLCHRLLQKALHNLGCRAEDIQSTQASAILVPYDDKVVIKEEPADNFPTVRKGKGVGKSSVLTRAKKQLVHQFVDEASSANPLFVACGTSPHNHSTVPPSTTDAAGLGAGSDAPTVATTDAPTYATTDATTDAATTVCYGVGSHSPMPLLATLGTYSSAAAQLWDYCREPLSLSGCGKPGFYKY